MSAEPVDLDQALRALAHPDRRRFILACRAAPRAAGELAALSDLSLASVSEHLKVLRTARLLVLDKQGRNWFYRADPGMLRAVLAALADLAE